MGTNGFNAGRDILIVERPNSVHVRGALIDFHLCDSVAEAERFLLHDVVAAEAAEAGARVFFTSFDQPADVWPHEFSEPATIDAGTAGDSLFHELADEPVLS